MVNERFPFYSYEKYKNKNGNWCYASVGYSTIYKYYAYPNNTRARLSQILILPPFQRLGIGTKMIEVGVELFLISWTITDRIFLIF